MQTIRNYLRLFHVITLILPTLSWSITRVRYVPMRILISYMGT